MQIWQNNGRGDLTMNFEIGNQRKGIWESAIIKYLVKFLLKIYIFLSKHLDYKYIICNHLEIRNVS